MPQRWDRLVPYDLFICHPPRGDAEGGATAFKEGVEADYRAFAGQDFWCFFDPDDIPGMGDWRHRILDGLRRSSLLLLLLSPAYVESKCLQCEIVACLKC